MARVLKMDDHTLITYLLEIGEGTVVDYKHTYSLSGLDIGKQAGILKDFLAFANTLRATPAYILVGVQDGTGEIIGLSPEAESGDASMQQFINSKVNRPIAFSYRTVNYSGQPLGLYTIEAQNRPFHIKKTWGGVHQSEVYIRRGSSNSLASPDEISQMGLEDFKRSAEASKVSVTPVDLLGKRLESLTIDYVKFRLEPSWHYPKTRQFGWWDKNVNFMTSIVNKDYFLERAQFIQEKVASFGFRLKLSNDGPVAVRALRIEVSAPAGTPDFRLVTRRELRSRPLRRVWTDFPHLQRDIDPTTVEAKLGHNKHTLSLVFDVDTIRAGEILQTEEIFLVTPYVELVCLGITFHADNLPSPIYSELPVSVTVKHAPLTMDVVKNSRDLQVDWPH